MKKLLGVLIVAATLVSSSFALNLSLGLRGLVGGNVGTEKAKTAGEGLVVGGGAFINLDLFGGFGLQGEANFVSNQVTTGEKSVTLTPCNMLDLPVMLWYNFNLAKLAIGGGVGVNFGTYTNKVFKSSETDKFNLGLALGANVKFYFNDHIGLVLGANGVFDFFPTEVVEGTDGTKTYLFGNSDNKRKSLYGTLGVEFKLF